MPVQSTVIITGAGGGIGRATAIELSRGRCDLVLVGRTQASLEATASRLDRAARVTTLAADITMPEEAKRITDQTLEAYGRIDALVNIAGYAPVLKLEETSVQEWRRVIDTNLSAVFYLSRAAWPALKRAAAGKADEAGAAIVNVSSEAGRDPFPGFCAYGAAKAGLNLFGLSLAREGAEFGVRVHTIAPAAVETPMLRGILTAEQYPAGKTLDPADVARVIAGCIDGNLRYTSGEVIYLHRQP